MKNLFKNTQHILKKIIVCIILLCFSANMVIPHSAYAQVYMPQPGTMVNLSPAYMPAIVRGIKVFPHNPLKFDFIVDKGESGFSDEEVKEESTKLIKYFLTTLTVPDEDLWVNLSPYEKDRIVPNKFGVTEMGRDLLAQDYLLKQITSSLMYPEKKLGQEFWDKVYKKAFKEYGTTDIPIDTFNKVWIVPEKAVVYENGDTAFVAESKLKVMLEEDYKAMQFAKSGGKVMLSRRSEESEVGIPTSSELNIKEASGEQDYLALNGGKEAKGVEEAQDPASNTSTVASSIIREVIIPELEKEVNMGKNFAALRQIYNSMILATWYKRTLKKSIFGKAYIGKNKVTGIDVADKDVKQKIYDQYIESFKKGAYDYIKEDFDPKTQQIVPRKYFSGGLNFEMLGESTNNILDVFQGYGNVSKYIKGLTLGSMLIVSTVLGFSGTTNAGTNKNIFSAKEILQQINPRNVFFYDQNGNYGNDEKLEKGLENDIAEESAKNNGNSFRAFVAKKYPGSLISYDADGKIENVRLSLPRGQTIEFSEVDELIMLSEYDPKEAIKRIKAAKHYPPDDVSESNLYSIAANHPDIIENLLAYSRDTAVIFFDETASPNSSAWDILANLENGYPGNDFIISAVLEFAENRFKDEIPELFDMYMSAPELTFEKYSYLMGEIGAIKGEQWMQKNSFGVANAMAEKHERSFARKKAELKGSFQDYESGYYTNVLNTEKVDHKEIELLFSLGDEYDQYFKAYLRYFDVNDIVVKDPADYPLTVKSGGYYSSALGIINGSDLSNFSIDELIQLSISCYEASKNSDTLKGEAKDAIQKINGYLGGHATLFDSWDLGDGDGAMITSTPDIKGVADAVNSALKGHAVLAEYTDGEGKVWVGHRKIVDGTEYLPIRYKDSVYDLNLQDGVISPKMVAPEEEGAQITAELSNDKTFVYIKNTEHSFSINLNSIFDDNEEGKKLLRVIPEDAGDKMRLSFALNGEKYIFPKVSADWLYDEDDNVYLNIYSANLKNMKFKEGSYDFFGMGIMSDIIRVIASSLRRKLSYIPEIRIEGVNSYYMKSYYDDLAKRYYWHSKLEGISDVNNLDLVRERLSSHEFKMFVNDLNKVFDQFKWGRVLKNAGYVPRFMTNRSSMLGLTFDPQTIYSVHKSMVDGINKDELLFAQDFNRKRLKDKELATFLSQLRLWLDEEFNPLVDTVNRLVNELGENIDMPIEDNERLLNEISVVSGAIQGVVDKLKTPEEKYNALSVLYHPLRYQGHNDMGDYAYEGMDYELSNGLMWMKTANSINSKAILDERIGLINNNLTLLNRVRLLLNNIRTKAVIGTFEDSIDDKKNDCLILGLSSDPDMSGQVNPVLKNQAMITAEDKMKNYTEAVNKSLSGQFAVAEYIHGSTSILVGRIKAADGRGYLPVKWNGFVYQIDLISGAFEVTQGDEKTGKAAVTVLVDKTTGVVDFKVNNETFKIDISKLFKKEENKKILQFVPIRTNQDLLPDKAGHNVPPTMVYEGVHLAFAFPGEGQSLLRFNGGFVEDSKKKICFAITDARLEKMKIGSSFYDLDGIGIIPDIINVIKSKLPFVPDIRVLANNERQVLQYAWTRILTEGSLSGRFKDIKGFINNEKVKQMLSADEYAEFMNKFNNVLEGTNDGKELTAAGYLPRLRTLKEINGSDYIDFYTIYGVHESNYQGDPTDILLYEDFSDKAMQSKQDEGIKNGDNKGIFKYVERVNVVANPVSDLGDLVEAIKVAKGLKRRDRSLDVRVVVLKNWEKVEMFSKDLDESEPGIRFLNATSLKKQKLLLSEINADVNIYPGFINAGERDHQQGTYIKRAPINIFLDEYDNSRSIDVKDKIKKDDKGNIYIYLPSGLSDEANGLYVEDIQSKKQYSKQAVLTEIFKKAVISERHGVNKKLLREKFKNAIWYGFYSHQNYPINHALQAMVYAQMNNKEFADKTKVVFLQNHHAPIKDLNVNFYDFDNKDDIYRIVKRSDDNNIFVINLPSGFWPQVEQNSDLIIASGDNTPTERLVSEKKKLKKSRKFLYEIRPHKQLFSDSLFKTALSVMNEEEKKEYADLFKFIFDESSDHDRYKEILDDEILGMLSRMYTDPKVDDIFQRMGAKLLEKGDVVDKTIEVIKENEGAYKDSFVKDAAMMNDNKYMDVLVGKISGHEVVAKNGQKYTLKAKVLSYSDRETAIYIQKGASEISVMKYTVHNNAINETNIILSGIAFPGETGSVEGQGLAKQIFNLLTDLMPYGGLRIYSINNEETRAILFNDYEIKGQDVVRKSDGAVVVDGLAGEKEVSLLDVLSDTPMGKIILNKPEMSADFYIEYSAEDLNSYKNTEAFKMLLKDAQNKIVPEGKNKMLPVFEIYTTKTKVDEGSVTAGQEMKRSIMGDRRIEDQDLKGNVVVIVGPSGAGKSTFREKFLAENKDAGSFVLARFVTTRKKTESDKDRNDIVFVSENEFEDGIRSGEIVFERNNFGGTVKYGTYRSDLIRAFDKGKTVVVETSNPEGVENVKKLMPNFQTILVSPIDESKSAKANVEQLKERLRSRGVPEADIDIRTEEAIKLNKKFMAFNPFVVTNIQTDNYGSDPSWLKEYKKFSNHISELSKNKDQAMLSEKDVRKKGGIDLNPSKLELERKGNKIDFDMPNVSLKELESVPGFIPIIIQITPVTSVNMLLGEADLAEPQQKKS